MSGSTENVKIIWFEVDPAGARYEINLEPHNFDGISIQYESFSFLHAANFRCFVDLHLHIRISFLC